MKNIHILPTNKPSRLIKAYNNKLLLTNVDIQSLRDGYQFQSIYITSDEEIKEEFLTKKIYVIDIQNGNIGKLTCKNNFFKGSSKLIEIEWKNKQNIWNYCHIRQIILTTDQDLIKDSVQAIPDEFLEWFVKNPNCEFVEVTYDKDAFPYGVKTSKKYGWFKIIIPQEEPKQECNKYLSCCRSEEECHCKKEPKTGSITECIKMIIDNQLNELEETKQIKCYCGHTITCDCEPLQETLEEQSKPTNPLDDLPIIGEGVLMEVSDDSVNWVVKDVFAKYKNSFVAWTDHEHTISIQLWKQARPINPKTKITRKEFEQKFEIID